MDSETKTFKYLMIGLIYPAVFGAIIYSFVDFIAGQSFNWGTPIYEDSKISMCKYILTFSLFLFYICDFLYSSYTKDFRFLYFLYEIIILCGLYVSFKGINYDSSKDPSIEWILNSFTIFMILYLFWDANELRQAAKEVEGNKESLLKRNFYKAMVIWESVILVSLAFVIAAFNKLWFGYLTCLTITSIIIMLATIVFFPLIYYKRKLYMFEIER